jgi:hypothetical protein
MYPDPDHPGKHWSEHLPSHYEMHNESMPGASNCIISYRLVRAMQNNKFDGIIIGFTDYSRFAMKSKIPGKEYISNCWVPHFSKQELISMMEFNDLLHFPLKMYNDYVIIKSCLDILEKSRIPYVWSKNMWDHDDHPLLTKIDDSMIADLISDLPNLDNLHSVNLFSHQTTILPSDPTFHVPDQVVQKMYAEECVNRLGI